MSENPTSKQESETKDRRPGARRQGKAAHRSARRVALLVLCSSVAGCSWVPLAPGSIEIRVVESESEVAGCKHLGDVRTRTKSNVGFVDRDAKTVSKELHRLARNEAVEMGADTILAVGTPTPEGTQKFRTYRCAQG